MEQIPWIEPTAAEQWETWVDSLPEFNGPLSADYSISRPRSALYVLSCAAIGCGALYLALLSLREVIGICFDLL